jgi:hypothetical protein
MTPKRSKPVPRRAALTAVAHSLAEARAAADEARRRGRDLVLLSPPGAAAYLGAAYFWALAETVRAESGALAVEAVMDCGDDPGWALAALRTGFKRVVLGGDRRARARVAAIARRLGARVLERRPRTTGRHRPR